MELKFTMLIVVATIWTASSQNDNKDMKIISVDSKQLKRGTPESSYSYAATDIGSKAGTHIKTITIIKNYGSKSKPLKINPELHKDEDWGSKFRDNFDSYGKIPEIPTVFKDDDKKAEDNNNNNVRDEIPIYEPVEGDAQMVVEEKMDEPKVYEIITENVNMKSENMEIKVESRESVTEANKSREDEYDDMKMAQFKFKKIPKDVELLKSNMETSKEIMEPVKSQALILPASGHSKSQRNVYRNSNLHSLPYYQNHQTMSTSYRPDINQQNYVDIPTQPVYSPLLFPSTPKPPSASGSYNPYFVNSGVMQSVANKKPYFGTPSSTQVPYVAPRIKKGYNSPTTTSPMQANATLSNAINLKAHNQRKPSRSRGLRY